MLCLLIFISVFNKDFDTNLLTKISTTESTPYIVSHNFSSNENFCVMINTDLSCEMIVSSLENLT